VEELQRLEDFHQQYKTQLHHTPTAAKVTTNSCFKSKMKTNPFTKTNQNEVSNHSDFAMQKLINASTPEINRFIEVVFTIAV
jgi:hypothetical protein